MGSRCSPLPTEFGLGTTPYSQPTSIIRKYNKRDSPSRLVLNILNHALERMDLLTSGMSTNTKEWKYYSDNNDVGTRMSLLTASKSTDAQDLQCIFDDCVRRSMDHPENVGMPIRTGEWPHLFSHEGRSMDSTTNTEEQSFPRNIEQRPHSPNNAQWQDLPGDKSELNKLVHWLYHDDEERLADALWLRYTKVAKVVYRNSALFRKHRYRVSKGVFVDTSCYPEGQPPIPYNILPAVHPFDGIDRLSALPHDIRLDILSHLLPPNVKKRFGRPEVIDHTLNNMALVSKSWRDQVDAFCGHELLVWNRE
jgi:hypothetical protein